MTSSVTSSAFESVLVAVRVRKKIPREEDKKDQWAWSKRDNQIWPVGLSDPRRFKLDRVLTPEDDNGRVYDGVVSPIIRGVVQGYNATVFAYGQSSSGKTHTMLGTEDDPGVMRRAVDQVRTFRHFITFRIELGRTFPNSSLNRSSATLPTSAPSAPFSSSSASPTWRSTRKSSRTYYLTYESL